MKLSIKMAFGSLCLLIHSIFPFLCETTGTDIVKELYHYVTNYKLKEDKNLNFHFKFNGFFLKN